MPRANLLAALRAPRASAVVAVLFACAAASFAQQPPQQQAAPYQSAGTRKMAALLTVIYRRTDWKTDPNKPADRIPYYQSLLSQHLSLANEVVVRQQLAIEMLNAGRSEDSIAQLEALRALVQAKHFALAPAAQHQLGEYLGLAYLRLGEQENCAHMHGQKSYIFPIRSSGVHHLPRGAEGAVREFRAA